MKEVCTTPRRVSSLLAASLAAVSLAACGSKPQKVVPISACPVGYTTGEKPLGNVSAADKALQAGIAELRSRTPVTVDNELFAQDVKPQYLGAFDAIFSQDNPFGAGGKYFQMGEPTRVDTAAEAFCYGAKPSELYLSPAAQAAIAGLGSAGIVVKVP